MSKYKKYSFWTCTILVILFAFVHSCNKEVTSNFSSINSIANLPELKKTSFKQIVTLVPREAHLVERPSDTGRVRSVLTGIEPPILWGAISHDNNIVSSTDTSEGPSTYTQLSPFCNRRDCSWSVTTGKLSYEQYGFSFAPGIEVFIPKGLGVDFRFVRIGDFGAQAGIALFQTKEIQPSIGLSYNLRLVKFLSNCDIFASYTPKTYIGGIRIELGSL